MAADTQRMQLRTPGGTRGAEEIAAWLVVRLAEALAVEATTIDVRTAFAEYGLDSAESVILAGDLEEWLGRTLPATLVWEYPTIEVLSRHLAGAGGAAAAPQPIPTVADAPGIEALLRAIEGLSDDSAAIALRGIQR